MPVKKIIEKIEGVTQNKVDNIIHRGKKEAEKAKQEIEEEKQRRLEELEKEKEREIKTMENRIISQAKLEAKKTKLNVREKMIEDIFKEAKDDLSSKDPEEYRDYLEESIHEVLEVLDGEITLRCDPKSEELVNELVRHRDSRIQVEPDLETIGGLKASSEKGSTMDLTFEANLESEKKELRKEISEILFTEED